ncbi:hypothetical protein BDQ12DRAFT_668513 [Crucibulum laeve]|uniref:Uncharacterized protein n=1 Tax=Crucibulum laeve TaxID=68775 RepID=A0A5C3LS54_9AGAR|nr:hypothetical protein BDQ12DRAFT_668513 [Crucibulum laeve]
MDLTGAYLSEQLIVIIKATGWVEAFDCLGSADGNERIQSGGGEEQGRLVFEFHSFPHAQRAEFFFFTVLVMVYGAWQGISFHIFVLGWKKVFGYLSLVARMKDLGCAGE